MFWNFSNYRIYWESKIINHVADAVLNLNANINNTKNATNTLQIIEIRLYHCI